jgi:large subunit ribosomal protein L12
VKSLAATISEVNIEEAIKAAPVGFAAPTAPAAEATAAEAAKPAEKKKKEGKEEDKKKEEEAMAGLGALFG